MSVQWACPSARAPRVCSQGCGLGGPVGWALRRTLVRYTLDGGCYVAAVG